MNTFIRSDDRPDGHKGRPCKGIINAHPTYKQRTCRPCKGIINAHPTYRQRTCRPCKGSLTHTQHTNNGHAAPAKGSLTHTQHTNNGHAAPAKRSLNGSIVPKESAVFILLRSGKSHHTTDNLYAMESAFKFFHALQQFVKRKRITINHRELHCLIIFLPYVKTFFRWS